MSATRSAARSVNSCCSSFCTWESLRRLCRSGLLFFLAGDAHARPRNRVEPGVGNHLAAVAAQAKGASLHALERFLDGLQDLGVGLLQLQLNVNLVVAAGLIRHVALPARVVLHRPLQGFGGAATEQLASLAEQRVPIVRHVHALSCSFRRPRGGPANPRLYLRWRRSKN